LLNFAYNIERFLLAAVPGQKDPDTFLPNPRLPPVTNAIRSVIRNLISAVVVIEKELIR